MEKPKLKLGKMTGKEIATWLGISYGTYSNNPAKQLSKLNFYCSYYPLLKIYFIQAQGTALRASAQKNSVFCLIFEAFLLNF